ncbi:SusC/RagA family TonB-linked outer membrane protein [Chitinophaga niabensis]|uniref:SusC/RagA family TonB-linked outer membrane protein n=1 Tax=Chitinophaga niabensis TaxID=536979 RepID=UPI0031BA84B9
MKLSAILMFVVCMQVSAEVRSQSTVSVKLSRTNLEKAFSLIELQSAYRFVYNNDKLPGWHKVSIDATEWPIKKVLEQMLANTDLTFRMMPNNLIVIAPAATVTKDLVVKGKIVSPSGELLHMVSVRLKNTTIGVFTNEKGEFELKVPEEGMLVFSYVGYVTQELAVNPSATMNVVLEPSANSMEEVVVVGYGVQRKMNTTGAVDQVAGKQLAERPIANIFQGLQGASPGLNINYRGGAPGTTPSINIRGVGSIVSGSNTTPLIIIDGITAATEDFQRLNPNDIGSVTILRDAASAAIYGARAAFGVVLITTKQGTSGGRQKISYNNYFASSRPTVLPDQVTDPYIFSRVLETATDNTPWDYVNYNDYYYQWAKERSDNPAVEDIRTDPNDPTKWIYMGNNNWNDYFFNKSSSSSTHSITLSGSSETGKGRPIGYYLSGDYTKENGLNRLAKDDWSRYGLRARVNFMPLSWLKVDNNLNIYQIKADAPSKPITDLYYLMPTQVAKNPDGTWANNAAGRLAAQLQDGGRNVQTRFGFQDVVRGVATFLDGDLQLTANASFKREMWKYNTDSRKYRIGFGPNDVREEGGVGSISVRNGIVKHDVYDLYANYNKKLGVNHQLGLLVGFNQEENTWSSEQAARDGLITSSLPYLGLATGTQTVGAEYTSYAIRGYFGRLNYSYKNRYILELNGRYDGSSRFLPSNRWGFFPSVSGAWIATEEPFMQALGKSLSTLKFRASYGALGNQWTSDFRRVATIPIGTSGYLINNTFPSIATGAALLPVDPQSYTWEKVNTFNVGTDIGFFNDRILFGFDAYSRKTLGMLTFDATAPAVMGVQPPPTNSADLNTTGWELSAGYRNEFIVAKKTFTFSTRFIISDSRTKITRYNQNKLGSLNNYIAGRYTGEIWGLESNGYFKNADEIKALDQSAIVPWGALEIVPGWPKYVDQNKDGKINKGNGTINDPGDYKVIGNNSTRYRFGFTLDMQWNGIDLNVFLQGVGKRDFYPRHYLFWGPYQQPYAGVYPWNLDFYRGASETGVARDRHSASYIAAGLADKNTESYFPVLQSWMADANYNGGGQGGLDIPQTKYLLNGAYLRIKNVTLGYTLPATLTKKYKVSRLRIFATGENLFEFSSIKKYYDPESIEDGYGWAYPFQRKYAMGINLDF